MVGVLEALECEDAAGRAELLRERLRERLMERVGLLEAPRDAVLLDDGLDERVALASRLRVGVLLDDRVDVLLGDRERDTDDVGVSDGLWMTVPTSCRA